MIAALATATAAWFAPAAPAGAATDPLLGAQWSLASGSGGIGAGGAWASSRGQGVTVAVLDSGVEIEHPDLDGALWSNPGEVPGNGRDDDANGIVDDVHGASLIDGTGEVSDSDGHGTFVAGIVAARAGNGTGVVGVAPEAQVMAVKVLDGQGGGDLHTVAAGIRYAVDAGALILSLSINGADCPPDLAAAVRYATERGATLVTSAGNDGRDVDAVASYPVALADEGVLGVTAGDRTGSPWAEANWGQRTVDLAAPGADVVSLARGGGYGVRSGTSAAAPHAAGALALLAAARPGLPQAALREILLQTARRTDPLAGRVATGQLDVGAAMHSLRPDAVPAPTAAVSATGLRLRLRIRPARVGRAATLRWSASGDTARVRRWRISLDGQTVATLRKDARRIVRRIRRPGRHRWRVAGFDAAGRELVSARRSFRATTR
jgi:subtilisin family serine protease